MFVQTREFEVRLISDPAGIVPTLRSEPDGPRTTVFPLAVFVGAAGVVGRGVGRVGVLTTGRGVERTGAGADGADVVGVDVAGTSVSCGCAVVS